MPKIETFIAFRYLQSKNKEKFISINTLFSLIGIILGVAALIVVMSIMNGFREELSSKIIGLNSDVIVSNSGNDPIGNYQEIIQKTSQLKEITNIAPVIQKQGLISKHNQSIGVVVKAISEENLTKQTLISDTIRSNALTNFTSNKIILGQAIANEIKTKIGDKLSLIAPEFNSTIFGKLPKMKDFIVSGVFRTGLTEYDQTTVFIPLSTGQIFYDMENTVNQIEIFTNNHNDAPALALFINQLLDDAYIVNDWQQINYPLFNALKTERVAMFTILTLIIIVAAFSIVSSLTMLVIDKRKEIAVLKTIGMSRISIMKIFLICGLTIGIVGTILGLSIGLAIAYNIQTIKEILSKITHTNLFDPVVYYLDSLPSKVDFIDVKNILLLVFISTLVSTIYPAWKAGKLNPVESLKSD